MKSKRIGLKVDTSTADAASDAECYEATLRSLTLQSRQGRREPLKSTLEVLAYLGKIIGKHPSKVISEGQAAFDRGKGI